MLKKLQRLFSRKERRNRSSLASSGKRKSNSTMKEKAPQSIEETIKSPDQDKFTGDSRSSKSKYLRSVTALMTTISSEFGSKQGQIVEKFSQCHKLTLTKSVNRCLASRPHASGSISAPTSPSFLNQTTMLKIHTKFSDKDLSFMAPGNAKNNNRRMFIRSSSVSSSHSTQNNSDTLKIRANVSEMSVVLSEGLKVEDNDFTPYSSLEDFSFLEETCSTPSSPAFLNNTALKRAYRNINQMTEPVSKILGKRYSEKDVDVDESAKEKFSLAQVPEICCQNLGISQSVCETADLEADGCIFNYEESVVERLKASNISQHMLKHEPPSKSLSSALAWMRPKKTFSHQSCHKNQVFVAKKLHDRIQQVNPNNSCDRIKGACEMRPSLSVTPIQLQRKAKSSMSDRFEGIRKLDDATRKLLQVDIIEPLNIDKLITNRRVYDVRHWRL